MTFAPQYKILVLDLDGTLTNSNKEISPANKEALMKAQMMGVRIVLASGRPTYGIEPLARELELDRFGGFILSFNGGQIIDYANKSILFERTVPLHLIPEIYQAACDFELSVVSYSNEAILTETPDDQYVCHEAWLNKMPIKEIDSFVETIQSGVPKCLLLGDGDQVGAVEQQISARFPELNIYRSEPFFLEVMPQGIDKAQSLARLLDHLNLNPEQMMACGDGFNDLSMIQYAGMGVAMSNAQPAVKAAAGYITFSNDHDGVAHAVERFILGSHQN
ncbi:MAG: Cof-type HAD-IIB family hydrolase [Breznakibacter sp.]|nr:HAD family phosphatase [Breznakibacter sp.]